MSAHDLKVWPSYFAAIQSGAKTFEVRFHDRDFSVGDVLVLREFDPSSGIGLRYTGREIRRQITYLMPGGKFGIAPDYCVLGLSREDVSA